MDGGWINLWINLYPPLLLSSSDLKDYPEYYRIIVEPIDLTMIRHNIESGNYTNLREIQEDILLMIKNAQYFNEPGSIIYKVYLSVCLSIYLFIYLSICLSIYTYLSIYLHVCICILIYLSTGIYMYVSIIYLSIYLCICLLDGYYTS